MSGGDIRIKPMINFTKLNLFSNQFERVFI